MPKLLMPRQKIKVAETDETVTARRAGGVKILTKHQTTKAKEKKVTAATPSLSSFHFTKTVPPTTSFRSDSRSA